MQVTIHAAKTNLSKLIEAALSGEEVIIAKGKLPVVKIVPLAQGPTSSNPWARMNWRFGKAGIDADPARYACMGLVPDR
jgi:prevent-host-death family protein